MRDSDRKSLELIYEDMEGRPMAQYGSNSAAQPSHVIGTEPMVQSEVEVPEDAGDKRESDDEEMDNESNLDKLLSDIKDTINSYEDKKQLRFNKELEEGFLGGALGGFTSGIKDQAGQGEQIASAAGNLTNMATNAAKNLYKRATNKQDLIIGDIDKVSGKPILPKKNSYVKALINGEINNNVTGKIIDVNENDKTYQVELVGLIAPKGGVVTRTGARALSITGINKNPYENMRSKELATSKYTFATRDEDLFSRRGKNKAASAEELELGVKGESIVVLDKDKLQQLTTASDPIVDSYSNLAKIQIFQYNDAVANKKEASQQSALKQKGVKPTAIKWVMFNINQEEEGANLTGITDKPSVGEVFNYKGINFISTNTGWTYPKIGDPKKAGAYVKATNPTLADEIQNAWLASKPPIP